MTQSLARIATLTTFGIFRMTVSQFSKEQLLACGRGELFGADNARLPVPPMLMMDRILKISDDDGLYGKGEIIAELDITPVYGFLTVTSFLTLSCQVAWA